MGKFFFYVNCFLSLSIIFFISQISFSQVPELIYYKFENNQGNTTPNYALTPVGYNYAPLAGMTQFSSGGQFDTCIYSNGSSNGGVVTGWNCDLGTGSWTISMWLEIPTTTNTGAYYIFGDYGAGAFRCYHNGLAGPNNLMLRGNFYDVLVTDIGPQPTVVHFVYDSAATPTEIKVYKNGVFALSVPQNPLNIPAGWGFKVGSYYIYSTPRFGRIDEFRVYRRALSPAEIAATWNQQLSPQPTVLFYEPFPNLSNWTVSNNGGSCVWHVYEPTYPNLYTLPATSSGPVAAADANYCGTGTTTLTTLTLANNLNCQGQYNIAMEWDNDWRHMDAQDIARVQVSYNGGATWVTLVEWAGVSKRNSHEVYMLPGATNNPNVKVRFVSTQPGWDWWWAIDNVKISADVISNVKTVSNEIPDGYSLSQNYPNPFNPVTTIDYTIPRQGLVTLKVYDILGREVRTLVKEVKAIGNYTVNFDGSKFTSGMYFYKLYSDDFIDVKKMVLLK